MALYPGEFRKDQLNEHIDDLLSRFKNHKLGDTIFRVGSDLQRKLGADDRFMAPIRMAIRTGHSYSLIIKAMSMGFFFKAVDEKGRMFPGDEAFHALWKQYPDRLLNEICGLDPARDAAIIQNLKNLVHRS